MTSGDGNPTLSKVALKPMYKHYFWDTPTIDRIR